MNKLFKYIIKDIKNNYKFYIFLILLIPLFIIKLDYNIYSPGSLIDLKDRIKVENAYESTGTINLTYVTSRPGNIPNIILSYLITNWDKEKIDETRIEDESSKEIIERNKIYLENTSYDAIIAAFKETDLKYEITNVNLKVSYVFNLAKTDLKTGDVIKSINNKKISSFDEFSNVIKSYKENDKINISVLRNDKIINCYAYIQNIDDKLVIGVYLAELKDVRTTPRVEYIFKDNESGSSRGLMCAIDIYNKITSEDITKGDVISGTGSIDENGIVGSIDGVKYKLLGAVKKRADVFIVPTENYEEAKKLKDKNNYDIELIEADNLHNVILKLKER